MEVSVEQVNSLEKKVQGIETKVDSILQLLQSIERGFHGDPLNGTDGLKQKQARLESEVDELKKQIAAIHEKNKEQDIALTAKKGVFTKWVQIAQWLWSIAIVLITLYLVFKGVLNVDALPQLPH